MGSRPQVQQARSRRQSHVATSLCSSHRTPLSRPKTLVATPNHHKAARTMSRHQIGVATRHQNQVATLLKTNLCHDINFMSRHQFHVATSLLPIMGFPGSNAEIHVATSHTAAHVATSNPCRDTVSPQPKQTRSRLHFLVATSRPTKLGLTQPSQVATPISGRDLKLLLKATSMSQPQIQVATLSSLNQVTTSLRSQGSSHSSFFLAQTFFSNSPLAFPATPKDVVACTLLFTHF